MTIPKDPQSLALQHHSLIQTLASLSICCKCILRYLGERSSELFAQSNQKTLQFLLGERNESNDAIYNIQSQPFICTICMGLLQHCQELCVHPLQQYLKEQNYDMRIIDLALILPISSLIRQHSLMLCLQSTHSEWDKNQVFELKDAIKRTISLIIKELDPSLSFFKPEDEDTNYVQVVLEFNHNESEEEHLFLTQVESCDFKIRKVHRKGETFRVGDSRGNVEKALGSISPSDFKKFGMCPPVVPTTRIEIKNITSTSCPVYVGGRYFKHQRGISQTPWIINGSRKTELSVSEVIGNVLKKAFRAEDAIFCSSGREDADVRMLGTGRPFYIELTNPRHKELSPNQWDDVKKEILPLESLVSFRQLGMVKKGDLTLIKSGEQTKKKTYRCLVWTASPISDDTILEINKKSEVVIQQDTPVRVLHRRAPLIRPKTIHELHLQRIEDGFLILYLTTEAGTYVKEFIHGDLGRTIPSLADWVGCETDILELDVLSIDLPWPPSTN